MGVNLLAYATRRKDGMERRMRDDEEINDFTRPPIGEGKEEMASPSYPDPSWTQLIWESVIRLGLQQRAQDSTYSSSGRCAANFGDWGKSTYEERASGED